MATPPHLSVALAALLDGVNELRATCQSVIDSLGPAQPFADLGRSLHRHAEAIAALMATRDLAVPPDRMQGRLRVAVSIDHACQVMVEMCDATIALCTRLEQEQAASADAEVAWLLRALKRTVRDLHRPALERRLACRRRGGAG